MFQLDGEVTEPFLEEIGFLKVGDEWHLRLSSETVIRWEPGNEVLSGKLFVNDWTVSLSPVRGTFLLLMQGLNVRPSNI